MDELQKIRADLEMLRRRADQQNVRRVVQRERTLVLVIIGGNTLDSGQAGIKHVTTQTTCPADYDPDVDTSYADGWGNAYLYVDGVVQAHKVLVCNDGPFSTIVESWELLTPGPSVLPFGSVNKVFYRGSSIVW